MKAITPKRRRQLLDPENIKAWTGAFTRRSPGASAVPPDILVDRYLADTEAETLRTNERLTGQLQASILDALGSLWGLKADGKSAIPDLLLLKPVRRSSRSRPAPFSTPGVASATRNCARRERSPPGAPACSRAPTAR
jgi:hypothetical protein